MKTTHRQRHCLLTIACVCSVPSPAPAFSSGPDPSYTGAPGETTCLMCHTPPVTRAGSLSFSGVPTVYSPSTTYPLTVTINDTGSRFGFELTAINSLGAQAGTLLNTTTNTQLKTNIVSGNTRQYIEQNFWLASSAAATWTFNWKAPAASVGPINFYGAAVRGDNMFTTNNDTVYTNMRTSLDRLRVAIARSGTNFVLSWTGGNLQYVDKLPATIWTNVPGNPSSPYTAPASQARRFYRTALP